MAPIVLGPAAVAYLASAAGKGSAGAWIAGRLGWFRRAPKGQQATAPAVARAPQAQITAGINPDGTLTPGVTLIVGFTVDNRGSGPAAQVTANVTLPAG